MSTVRGAVPGLVLLPAQDLLWEKITEPVTIVLPTRGKISELPAMQNITDGVKIPGEDEFCLMEEGVFRFIEMVRVLFAVGKYPNLKGNECFIVFGVEDDGPDSVIIHGQVVRVVEDSLDG